MGNARTYLLAWLSARSQGGEVILRIEDIDSPRIKPWATAQAMEDLAWLGLDWDAGPSGATDPRASARSLQELGPFIQTERIACYQAALSELRRRELIYPCTCTRSDIEQAASAPHVGQEGPIYPGTCSQRSAADVDQLEGQSYSWRFRVPIGKQVGFEDLAAGPQSGNLARDLGDFVIYKSDGTPAYQLAVVVDDHEMGITEVVRGDDLIPSTFRQLALYDAFGWTPPRFGHVPLVIGPDGRRLAKRHGDTRISVLRERGFGPESLIGLLAWSAGLQDSPQPSAAADLVPDFAWSRVRREPFVFAPSMWDDLRS